MCVRAPRHARQPAQGVVKLCDFGLAIDQKFEQANTRLGTFGYFAPEVLDCPLKKGPFDFKGEPGVPSYGCKVRGDLLASSPASHLALLPSPRALATASTRPPRVFVRARRWTCGPWAS